MSFVRTIYCLFLSLLFCSYSVLADQNESTLQQKGSQHRARIEQSGSANEAFIRQYGDANGTTDVTGNGCKDPTTMLQNGSDNLASIDQSDKSHQVGANANKANLEQNGRLNKALFIQTQNNLCAKMPQPGDQNVIELLQVGNEFYPVSGSPLGATILQKGNDNRVFQAQGNDGLSELYHRGVNNRSIETRLGEEVQYRLVPHGEGIRVNIIHGAILK